MFYQVIVCLQEEKGYITPGLWSQVFSGSTPSPITGPAQIPIPGSAKGIGYPCPG